MPVGVDEKETFSSNISGSYAGTKTDLEKGSIRYGVMVKLVRHSLCTTYMYKALKKNFILHYTVVHEVEV